MKPLLEKHWHHLPQEEVLDLLDTDMEKGLDRFEIENRQQNFGPNALTQRKGQGPLMNRMFHTAPIGVMDWVHIPAVGLVIYLVIGVEKTLRQRWEMGASEI